MHLLSKPLAAFSLLLAINSFSSEPRKPFELWPGSPPGNSGAAGDERDMTGPKDGLIAGRGVIRLGNVARPTIDIYKPPADKNTGAAVLVCPGGAYRILA